MRLPSNACRRRVGSAVKERPRVKHVMAEKLIRGAMDGIAARLRRRIHVGRSLAAEFSRINGFLNLEFLNGLDRGGNGEVVEVLVGNRNAVEPVHVVADA